MVIRPQTTYKHYKGGLYYYLQEAQHTETGERLVIYSDGLKIWARPYSMFFGYVNIDGEEIRRFKPISLDSNS